MNLEQALEELRRLSGETRMLSIGPLGSGAAVYDNNSMMMGGVMIASECDPIAAIQAAKERLEGE